MVLISILDSISGVLAISFPLIFVELQHDEEFVRIGLALVFVGVFDERNMIYRSSAVILLYCL